MSVFILLILGIVSRNSISVSCAFVLFIFGTLSISVSCRPSLYFCGRPGGCGTGSGGVKSCAVNIGAATAWPAGARAGRATAELRARDEGEGLGPVVATRDDLAGAGGVEGDILVGGGES